MGTGGEYIYKNGANRSIMSDLLVDIVCFGSG